MISSFRIQGIGLLILLMLAVRVSITPGVKHRHEHGNHPHSHHHAHGPHSHAHESTAANTASEAASSTAHIHIFIFGWEFTFNSPFGNVETQTHSPEAVAESPDPRIESLPDGPFVTSATSGGTLIQWVFDLRSPAPPGKIQLPQGMFSGSLFAAEQDLASRDRD